MCSEYCDLFQANDCIFYDSLPDYDPECCMELL